MKFKCFLLLDIANLFCDTIETSTIIYDGVQLINEGDFTFTGRYNNSIMTCQKSDNNLPYKPIEIDQDKIKNIIIIENNDNQEDNKDDNDNDNKDKNDNDNKDKFDNDNKDEDGQNNKEKENRKLIIL